MQNKYSVSRGLRAFRGLGAAAGLLAVASVSSAQSVNQLPDSATRAKECPSCAEWNAPHKGFRLFGNAWYVGTNGLASVLLTSNGGHILLDGGLPESAPLIAANVQALGFRMEDVKLIVNSHDHFDHAGGIAALQKLSGARVAATASSAKVLQSGESGPDDPQFGLGIRFPGVSKVEVVTDGQKLRVGNVEITAHATGGHTPGGTSWSWKSCEGSRCLDMVYADSQTPISADNFYFTRNTTYPNALADFRKGFATLESVRCDILITPHPDASQLWTRLAARDAGNANALVDAMACQRYAASARKRLDARIATEGKPPR